VSGFFPPAPPLPLDPTGPPYPPGPTVGSNAIGVFRIGISQIGDISAFNEWATVISQYANSPIITGMIDAFNAAADETQNLSNFYDLIFNVATAQGYGLDVWGRIVGVTRSIQLPSASGTFFGFNEPGDPVHDTGFGQSPFYNGGGALTTNITLSDSDFRNLVYAKALANITSGSITAINQILLTLFPHRGNCYVTDGLNMTMTYTFTFTLTGTELSILQFSGVLPRPAGVSATVIHP
jgi:hypothetical protein